MQTLFIVTINNKSAILNAHCYLIDMFNNNITKNLLLIHMRPGIVILLYKFYKVIDFLHLSGALPFFQWMVYVSNVIFAAIYRLSIRCAYCNAVLLNRQVTQSRARDCWRLFIWWKYKKCESNDASKSSYHYEIDSSRARHSCEFI